MTETNRTAGTKTGRRTTKKTATAPKAASKKTAAKKTASTTPRKKAPVGKTTPKKKAAARKAAPRQRAALPAVERTVTLDERQRMVAEAAFYKAAARGFVGGSSERDWFEAETEIDAMLMGRAGD